MKRYTAGVLLATCILGTTGLAEDTQREGKLAFVDTGKWIYMREDASTDSKALAILDDHASVYIYEEMENGWVEVSSGSYCGYVKKARLATGEKAAEIAAQEGKEIGTVYPEALNIRFAPNLGEPIDVTYKGQELVILEHDGDWIKVVTPSGGEGYVHSAYCDYMTVYPVARAIEEPKPAKEEKVIPVGCGEMTKEDLWKEIYGDQPVVEKKEKVQPEKSQEKEPVTEAKKEEPVWTEAVQEEPAWTEAVQEEPAWIEAVQEEPAWIEAVQEEPMWTEAVQEEPMWTEEAQEEPVWTETPQEEPAWTEAAQEEVPMVETTPQEEQPIMEETQTTTSSLNGQAIVDYATQFVGNKYVWGGTDPVTGSDCSGFTQAVYNNFGISIPRVADSQKVAGTEVSVENAQVGDLMFFGENGGEADHVAIYMGNNMIIHSSSEETGVIISDISYGGNLIGAATYNVNNDYY